MKTRPSIWMLTLLCLTMAGGAKTAGAADDQWTNSGGAATASQNPSRVQIPDYPALEGSVVGSTYVLGPGDLLELALYGRATAKAPVTVDAEGQVYIPSLGHVKVGGLTLDEARLRLASKFERGFHGVKVDMTLLRPRKILVHVIGEVLKPGMVELQAPGRVSEAVRLAGGFSTTASRRNVAVQRGGASAMDADLEKYRVLGSLADNPMLDNGDVVRVPAAGAELEIAGEVARPGLLEFRPGDHVSDALALAGGLRAAADSDSVEIWRFRSAVSATSNMFELHSALLAPRGSSDPRLQPGDRLFVRNVPNWHRRGTVIVTGEVLKPGSYAIPADGELASTLLNRFGGFTPFADVRSVTVFRPSLQPTRDTAYVNTLRSGSSQISHEDAEYLKMHALAEGNLSNRLRTYFDQHDSSADFRLLDGDMVLVPGRTRSVAVYGAVRAPGVVDYQEGARYSDYIERVGGFGDRADRSKARVTRVATGQPVSAQDVSTINEGDIIWVPEREPKDFLKTVSGVMSFLAQFATIYLVIHQATKN